MSNSNKKKLQENLEDALEVSIAYDSLFSKVVMDLINKDEADFKDFCLKTHVESHGCSTLGCSSTLGCKDCKITFLERILDKGGMLGEKAEQYYIEHHPSLKRKRNVELLLSNFSLDELEEAVVQKHKH